MTGVATTAIAPDAGTITGASLTIRARRRSAVLRSSEPPPESCSPVGASPVPATSPCPRDETARQISSVSARNPATSGCCARRRARSRSCRAAISSSMRASAASVTLCRPRALLARRPSAVQECRTRDERAEECEPQREHRSGHEPQHHRAGQRHNHGEDRERCPQRGRRFGRKGQRLVEELERIRTQGSRERHDPSEARPSRADAGPAAASGRSGVSSLLWRSRSAPRHRGR